MQAEPSTGRINQRLRTREEIVSATIELLRQGRRPPSAAEIAAAARVSRRTIYLHFPTMEQLLVDAEIGLLSQLAVEQSLNLVDPGGDVGDRVEAMVRAIIDNARTTLPLGRALIRLTVENGQSPGAPRRGLRRVAWIEFALAPLRETLAPERFERLVSALSVVVGWEALIVLADIRGLNIEAQRETIIWTARTIVRAALEEASQAP